MCVRLPGDLGAQCEAFVKEYGDLVLSLLVQELDPNNICTAIKLCSAQQWLTGKWTFQHFQNPRNVIFGSGFWTKMIIPSYCLWDNSVHLHECSPFLVGIFIIFKKKITMFTVWCRHTPSDWQSIEAFVYVIGESNIITWKYIIVLDI